jgi:hypothetical protein
MAQTMLKLTDLPAFFTTVVRGMPPLVHHETMTSGVFLISASLSILVVAYTVRHGVP